MLPANCSCGDFSAGESGCGSPDSAGDDAAQAAFTHIKKGTRAASLKSAERLDIVM
jgi:hypothetical protein